MSNNKPTDPVFGSAASIQKLHETISPTRISWIAGLHMEQPPPNATRKTSIICTIGPKTATVEALIGLRKAGMNIVRMNFSHGSHEYHGSVVKNVRESMRLVPGRPLAIALDTKGPEIRTGTLKEEAGIVIPQGHEFWVSTDDSRAENGDLQTIYMDYKNLPKAVQPGGKIFVDDGILCLIVLECTENAVKVRANNSHRLLHKKGCNLPGAKVDLPALSERDKQDLLFGVEQGVDMIFASFIRTPKDVLDIRKVLGEKGKNIKIISKIESTQGVANFDEILQVSDGIMVARGDLGIEIPPEKVFLAQKTMVMLSGETARGIYPNETVQMMHNVVVEAESTISYVPLFEEMRLLSFRSTGSTETVACSAVNASLENYIQAIIVLTTSGESARYVAKFRPQVPILTVTRSEQVARQIHLHRGCYPLYYPKDPLPDFQEDVDTRIQWAMNEAKKMNLMPSTGHVIAIQGWRGGIGNTNTMRVLPIQ